MSRSPTARTPSSLSPPSANSNSKASAARIQEARQFLQLLYGEAVAGYLCLFTLSDRAAHWLPIYNLAQIAHEAVMQSEERTCYFGIGLHPEPLPPEQRGEAAGVIAIPGLWMECDVRGPAHQAEDLPESEAQILALLHEFPHPLSVVVNSGHGLHAWWLFKEPWVFDTPEERQDAQQLVRRLQRWFQERARAQGWKIDPTHDLARVLRLPGTINRKPGLEPKPVSLIHTDTSCRHNPSDFDWLPTVEEETWEAAAPGDFAPAAIEPILEGCGWLRHCRDQAKTLGEPDWYAALGIVGRCADGKKRVHEFSRPYPGYDEAATNEKLTHALKAAGPRTCANIKADLSGEKFCKECPNWGKIKSPILLGAPATVRVGSKSGKAQAAASLDELIAQVKANADPGIVFQRIDVLADLSAANLGKAKADLKTILGKTLNLNDLTAAINEARKQQQQRRSECAAEEKGVALPRIIVTDRPLRDVAADAMQLLAADNDPTELFIRAGAITRIRPDENHRPIIEPVSEAALRGRLTRAADFFTLSEQGERHVPPPLDVVRDVLSIGRWPFPALEAVVEVPVLRPDGTILDRTGYDPATRLFYAPDVALRLPPIPDRPTLLQAQEACRFVCAEALGDFPYAGKADKANALGLVLTPIIRQAITGCVPIGVIDAPAPGTGKGLLSSVVATIPTGRPAGMMSAPEDEAEWRKQITSALLEGSTVVVIDNVDERLASASLSRAVTAPLWKDRLLGTNQQPPLPQRATWIVNGNNVQLGGDIPRRCFRIRLDAKAPQPWLRTKFRHPELLAWVTEHRGELLAALLTVCRAWFVAGQPAATTPILGSFEDWSRIIGGILGYLGVEGFLGNIAEMYENAADGVSQWQGFFVELHGIAETQIPKDDGLRKMTTRKIASLVFQVPELKSLLPDPLLAAFAKSAESFVLALGQALPRQVDVRYGDVRLIRCGNDNHRKCPLWTIHKDE